MTAPVHPELPSDANLLAKTVGPPSGGEPDVFKPRTAIWLAAIAAVSLAAGLVFSGLAGDLSEDKSDQANAFSRSAIGHHAFAEWLRSQDINVVVSRHSSADKAGPSAPLLIVEPVLLEPGDVGPSGVPLVKGLDQLIQQAQRRGAPVVVVLPKWQGRTKPGKKGWVSDVYPWPRSEVARVLATITGGKRRGSHIVRRKPGEGGEWFTEGYGDGEPTLKLPQLLSHQAMTTTGQLRRQVFNEQGVLVAKTAGSELYVISDPDLLSTAGLGKGGNAKILHSLLVERLAPESVVIDETLHGFGRPPSLWADLLRYPLLLVTLHVLLIMALTLWMLLGRFGKPEPAASRVSAGKRTIVDSTAELLSSGAHSHDSLWRYFRMSVRRAALACALPHGIGEKDQIAQLSALGRARGVSEDLEALSGEVLDAGLIEGGTKRLTPKRSLAIARRIHRFCKDITRQNGH